MPESTIVLPASIFDAFVAALDTPRPVNTKARAIMRLRARWAD